MKRGFFQRSVHVVAPELIGVELTVDGVGGLIVEVEAYDREDPASHAYLNRRTPRNGAMFADGGLAYVYRSYGIHWCLNLVCGPADVAEAALVRALEPTRGLDEMRRRRGVDDDRLLCSGPGRLCQALGITGDLDGLPLDRSPFALRRTPSRLDVVTGVRVGLTKAVDRPWRYAARDSRYVSRPRVASPSA